MRLVLLCAVIQGHNSRMPVRPTSLRHRLNSLHRNLRGASMVVRAFASTDHPLLAHIIPIRRCNLACTYCNEFDDVSQPVPTGEMFKRAHKLAKLPPPFSPPPCPR